MAPVESAIKMDGTVSSSGKITNFGQNCYFDQNRNFGQKIANFLKIEMLVKNQKFGE